MSGHERVGVAGHTHGVLDCDFCGRPYDPVGTRWLCPHCHMKNTCCDGAPCPLPGPTEVTGAGRA